jgi:L,D-transpeptidase YcbB
MRRFLLVTTTMAAALILSATAFAENNQYATVAPQVVDGASNSSTVPQLDGTPSEGSEFSKEAEPSKPIQSAEDVAITERLRDLVENNLQQYVPRAQDRTGIEGFYRKRNFVPLWVSTGKLLPHGQQAMEFLHGVAADGLDPKDYPTPRFADPNPSRLAADELTLTNSIAGTGAERNRR